MNKLTKTVYVKNVPIGGNNPIVIQSMTTIKTEKVEEVVEQIERLVTAGASLVRLAIIDENDAIAIKEIKQKVDVPLIGDIHFDYRLAIMAVENGINKIRINPGNIGGKEKTQEVIKVCKKYHVPIRIGVNSGSIEQDFIKDYSDSVTSKANALVDSLSRYVEFFEEVCFHDIVLSIKATDLETTIVANRLASAKFDYPIHIGLTESGTVKNGIIRSSYVLGTLLHEGIGSTIRVSLTGDPVQEIPVCKEILSMFNLYQKPTLVSCPTCGRTEYPMNDIIKEIEPFLEELSIPITIAIMGCVVNGPGEASHTDIGIAGEKTVQFFLRKEK